jgi:hypothetical protein
MVKALNTSGMGPEKISQVTQLSADEVHRFLK